MFKIPDWGDDVPKAKANFERKTKKPNKQQSNNSIQTKQSETSSAKSPQNGIKKKKRKNKKQSNAGIDNAGSPSTPKNMKANGPRFVAKRINGDNNRKVFNNKKNNLNASNNENNLNKKTKLKNKFNKKPQNNVADSHISPSGGDNKQNVPKKGKKRKKPMSKNKTDVEDNSETLDNEVSNAKKKKIDNNFKPDDQEDFLFGYNNKAKNINKKKKEDAPTILNKKKEKIKQLLESQIKRTPIKTSGNKLRDRMLERLKAAQFRYINEKLYTSSGSDAQQLFQNDPAAFQTYHEGYQQQVKKWPVNPLSVIVKRIQKMPKTHLIADMGCGEAALSKRIPHKVRSFDLVATSPAVEVCDIAHTPLLAASMDVAVYCLALMGTDLTQYLVEANRVLKMGGYLLIAEVESRFNKVEDFTKEVERLGFKLKNLDKTHQVFFFMEFIKIRDPPAKKSKLPALTLKPCLYKRR